MDRDQKRNEVAELKGTFSAAKSAVVLEFKGLTVDKDTTFRKNIRESKAQYRVSKNTLLRLAVKETAFESLTPHFKGATAVATTENDVVSLAKAVNNFLKDNPAATFKGAILDGQQVSVAEFKTIAELPSREVLVSKLLYLMQYPISGLAVALDQIRKQKEGAA
ncbi:50S ribosomal protein L10 [Holophaga foetida]|uniref:50S ribosomal protein L10 n=1 Tax=Holophaga foetida TaxID=35839 RepID=UPI000247184C|nr:50S ribosomal protein L10 [Holophaga foetida]